MKHTMLKSLGAFAFAAGCVGISSEMIAMKKSKSMTHLHQIHKQKLPRSQSVPNMNPYKLVFRRSAKKGKEDAVIAIINCSSKNVFDLIVAVLGMNPGSEQELQKNIKKYGQKAFEQKFSRNCENIKSMDSNQLGSFTKQIDDALNKLRQVGWSYSSILCNSYKDTSDIPYASFKEKQKNVVRYLAFLENWLRHIYLPKK